MANYTEPFTAVLDHVYPKLAYNAYHNKEDTLILWLKQHCNVPFSGSGQYFRAAIQEGHTDRSTDFVTGYEVLNTDPVNDQDHIRYEVAGFGWNITTSNWDTKVRVGNDKNKLYDYALSKVKTATLGATRKLAQDLYDDNGNDSTANGQVVGLGTWLDQSDTTIGGLTRGASTNAGLWPVEDTTTTTITWPALENAYMDVYAETDVIITTKDIYGFIWALRQPQERYNPSGGGKEFGQVGAPVIHFNHIPIVWDANCRVDHTDGTNAAGGIYLLSAGNNSGKHILYFTHRDWDLGVEKVCDNTKDQEITIARILWAGQLMIPVGKYQARFTNISA